jgi:hypothetical protein
MKREGIADDMVPPMFRTLVNPGCGNQDAR